MSVDSSPTVETDSRFPSGPWTGFFLHREAGPGKSRMELKLTFAGGVMKGEGRDWVGDFLINGRYNIQDGRCYWTKSYVGKHDVFYNGFNEGRGIWGTWEIVAFGMRIDSDGFHIWPEGMPDPTQQRTSEEVDLPWEELSFSEPAAPMAV